MMNLKKSSDNKAENKNSLDHADLNKRISFSQTLQPSLKNIYKDMVKIIEEEINQVADSNKLNKHITFIFGVI